MIDVVRATPSDIAQVTSLFEKYRAFYRCAPAPGEAERFLTERLENGDSTIFLARAAGETGSPALGFTQLYPLFSSTAMKRLWLLNDLFVEESHRRRGIGERLIAAGIELARTTKARGLFLETEATNTRAQGLYEKMGFQRNGNYFYGLDF